MSKNTKKRAVIYSNVKENKKLAAEKEKIKSNQINLNDEVIIGFNTGKNGKNSNSKKVNNKAPSKGNTSKEASSVNPQKVKKLKRIIKISVLVIVLLVGIVVFLKSPVFTIKEISINLKNNAMLTEADIDELKIINVGQNMFSINKNKAIQSIKTNSYVDTVKITRKLPNKIQIEVVERSVRFKIKSEDGYIYVDNKGVVIEQSLEQIDGIDIVGHKTENIVNGEKLNNEDLKGLSDVIMIIREAKNNEIYDSITKIDMSNHDDYLVYFDTLGKVAHIGDIKSINDKMTRVAKILKIESDYEGEIFVNVNFNNGEYPYFREKV